MVPKFVDNLFAGLLLVGIVMLFIAPVTGVILVLVGAGLGKLIEGIYDH